MDSNLGKRVDLWDFRHTRAPKLSLKHDETLSFVRAMQFEFLVSEFKQHRHETWQAKFWNSFVAPVRFYVRVNFGALF